MSLSSVLLYFCNLYTTRRRGGMPSMFGGDQCGKDYAPHMWLGDHFIHNSEKIIQEGEWWYRAGRLYDETLVAERWKGGRFPFEGQTDREIVPADQIPTKLQVAMNSVSRIEQEAFQQQIEQEEFKRQIMQQFVQPR